MTIRSLLVIALVALTPQLHGCAGVVAAGAGTAVLVTQDRRTSGAYVEDQNIETKTSKALEQRFGENDKIHINVTSYNRYVLLTGQVPDEEIKKQAGVSALGIENVRNVQNELHQRDPNTYPRTARTAYALGREDTERLDAASPKVIYH